MNSRGNETCYVLFVFLIQQYQIFVNGDRVEGNDIRVNCVQYAIRWSKITHIPGPTCIVLKFKVSCLMSHAEIEIYFTFSNMKSI